MQTGADFLRSQIDDAVKLHRAFVDVLRDHGRDADDQRFSELCAQYMPIMEEQQRRLEELQESLGSTAGSRMKVMGRAAAGEAGAARELADVAREDDFRRLVGDIATSGMAEDTFLTFREAGRTLGEPELARVGAMGEQEHDDFNRDAKRLAQAMFVEHVKAGERRGRTGAVSGVRADR